MNRLPHITLVLAAVLLVAADKKTEKAENPAPSAAQIQQWVKQLGDERFKVREEATQNLLKARGAALDALTKAAKSKDFEVKQRALMIIKHPEEVAKRIEKAAIAYFKKLGGAIKVDENNQGRRVKVLYLGATKITDAGLVHLKGLTKLRYLFLPNTGVTDAGLVHLKGLTKLRVLDLGGTKVTRAGIEKLQQTLPVCRIDWDRK